MTACRAVWEGPALAGALDPAEAPGSDRVEHDLVSALGASTAVERWSAPGLAVAWTRIEASVSPAGLCLVDGALDNRLALASELGLIPTTPQPELVLSAWRRWGNALPSRLRGENTVVLAESTGRKALIARDALGGRPLFVARAGGLLFFASEVRLLLALLPERPAPDRLAVLHWLANSAHWHDRTLYSGIEPLPAAHALALEGRALHRWCHWAPRYVPPGRLGRGEAVEAVAEGLSTAVRRRVAGHEDATGVLLSGGLDSSSVAAVARDVLGSGARPTAYSATFPGHPEADESHLLMQTAEVLGLRSVGLRVEGGSAIAPALDWLDAWSLPLVAPTMFFMGPLLQMAAEDGVRVLLDGEGGDELFGHEPLLMADCVAGGRPLAALGLARRLPGAGNRPPLRPLLRILQRWGLSEALPDPVRRALGRDERESWEVPEWFDESSRRLFYEHRNPGHWERDGAPRWFASLAHRLTIGREVIGMPQVLAQRASAAGLTSAHPFLDRDLVELMLTLPPGLAYDADADRPLLRAALAGRLPQAVLRRPYKSYFDPVFRRSLLDTDRRLIEEVLGRRDLELAAYVDVDRLRVQLLELGPEGHPRGRDAWGWETWRAVTGELWLRSQHDPGLSNRLRECYGGARLKSTTRRHFVAAGAT